MDQNAADRPMKRLRLGTRSCAECRRRKVRCIFGPDKKTCNECTLHAVECIPQGVKKQRNPESLQDDKDVHEKLANLEEMVRRIWSTMDFQSESPTPSQIEFNTAEVLRRITAQTSSSAQGSEYGSVSGQSVTEPNTPSGTSISNRTVSDPFADAPLLNLFRDAMLIQDVEVQSSAAKPPYDHRLASCVKTFQTLLPRPDDLNAILSATQIFWRVWTDAQGLCFGTDKDSLTSARSAYMYIQKSMQSRQPATVAKAVLFLALCIQQVTNRVTNEELTPSTRSKMTLNPYIILVDMLLSISENSTPTTEGLECLDILAKLYMNMGKPRESWLSIRRGINLALLLRLHHTDERSMLRERKIWSHLWQGDRQLSMVLGLPSATTDFHPGLGHVIGDSIAEPVMYQISVIAGHINERNQNSAATDYYRTIQIDQEIRTCLQRIPSEWWNAQSTDSTPVEMVYGLQVLKIQLYMLQKNLHQPYMLKSFTNTDYEPSNSTACDASREMIYAYQTLRQHPSVGFIICDLMDFQVFTAAVVLVINLLWSPAPSRNYRHDNDWKLVQSVTDILKKVAESMSCNVASQASQILEYLAAAHNGTYTGPQQFEAVIPYFGQVKINRFFPRSLTSSHPTTTQIQNSSQPNSQANTPAQLDLGSPHSSYTGQIDAPMYSPSTIDFAANSFAPFSWDQNDFFAGAELGIDWTSLSDGGVQYDWSQHFDCSGLGAGMGMPGNGGMAGQGQLVVNPHGQQGIFGDGGQFLVV